MDPISSTIFSGIFNIISSVVSNSLYESIKTKINQKSNSLNSLYYDSLYEAFLDLFINFDSNISIPEDQKSKAKILKKIFSSYLDHSNKIWLIDTFREESDFDFDIFLMKIRSNDTSFYEKISTKLIIRFNLINSNLDHKEILEILSKLLSYYYDSLLTRLSNEESKRIILNTALKNTQLIGDLSKEINEIKSTIQNANKQLISERSGFNILNIDYWDEIKSKDSSNQLPNYYLRTDSRPPFLKNVIANEYYVINHEMRNVFNTELKNTIDNGNTYSLIKILSKGGEGKSTFLLDVAKYYVNVFNILYIDHIQEANITIIRNSLLNVLSEFNKELPILVIIDSPDSLQNLINITQNLFDLLFEFKIVFIIGERNFRYENMESKADFEDLFYHISIINYSSDSITNEIGRRLFNLLHFNNDTQINYNSLPSWFVKDKRESISEKIYSTLSLLQSQNKISFKFDWQDWDDFVKKYNKDLKWNHLYTLVAMFYQFGKRPKKSICSKYLNIPEIDFIHYLNDDQSLPIHILDDSLILRHENVAKWYFDITNEQTKRISKYYFANIIKQVKDSRDVYHLLWILKSSDFKDNFLFDVLIEQLGLDNKNLDKDFVINNFIIDTLTEYISTADNANDYRTYNDIGIAYLKIGKVINAKNTFIQSILVHDNQIQARIELAKIYIDQKEYNKAIKILMESIDIDPSNIHSRIHLGKLYLLKNEFELSRKNLLEALSFDKRSVHAMTELGRLYLKMNLFDNAISILTQVFSIDPNAVHSRVILGKVYLKQEKYNEAKLILEEAISIDCNDLYARVELSKVFKKLGDSQNCEKVLLDSLKIKPDNLHTITLLHNHYIANSNIESAKQILEYTSSQNFKLNNTYNLGLICVKKGLLNEAKEIFLSIISNKFNQKKLLNIISLVLKNGRDIPELWLPLIQKAIEETSKQINFINQLSYDFLLKGNLNEANDLIIQGLKLNPNSISLQINYLHLLCELDLFSEYKLKVNLILSTLSNSKSDNFPTKKYMAICILLVRKKEINLGIWSLLQYLEKDKTNIHMITYLIKLYQINSEYDECEKVLLSYLDYNENNEILLFLLSRVYHKQKRYFKYEDVLFRILTINPNNIDAILELSSIFRKFKKFHIVYDLLSRAYSIDKKNIQVLHKLIDINIIFRNYDQVDNLLKCLDNEKSNSSYSLKYNKDFEKRLNKFKQIGTYNSIKKTIISDSNKFIKIVNYGSINNKIKNRQKVYYSTFYIFNSNDILADFIEPYYHSLNNLIELK
ncbi:MAG: tetratricopeptide repeat protein [Saprospiraceae bacterium]|nr:tetratricopeptide repeat protein [Saprospiraceae bacterium]